MRVDHLGLVALLDPVQHDRGVQAARVEQQHAADLGGVGFVGGGPSEARWVGVQGAQVWHARSSGSASSPPDPLDGPITAGLVVFMDVGLTLAWREPISSIYGSIKQSEARDQLAQLEGTFPSPADRRRVAPIKDPRRQVAALADAFARRVSTQRSTKFRAQIRRRERVLQRDHGLEVREANASTLDDDLTELLRLHDLRWEGRGSSLKDSAKRSVLRDFAHAAQCRGWRRLRLLAADGVSVAGFLGWRLGGSYVPYQGGFDPRWSNKSVGIVLTRRRSAPQSRRVPRSSISCSEPNRTSGASRPRRAPRKRSSSLAACGRSGSSSPEKPARAGLAKGWCKVAVGSGLLRRCGACFRRRDVPEPRGPWPRARWAATGRRRRCRRLARALWSWWWL